MNIITNLLGMLMWLCYKLVDNYAVAIILFTIFTKVVLLPISIWVQKNSIKMVRMQPEINHIKAKYFGFQDQIAEETSALYKREKYSALAGLIPMLAQLVLLMGLVGVIYNPLTHILHVDNGLVTQMVALTGELTGADITSSSIQMTVVDAIKNPAFYANFAALQDNFKSLDVSAVLASIQGLNMSIFGQSLALLPYIVGGITLLMPVAAAFAAWILCVGQNALNPLQAEQSNPNKYGMMIFSVGISLFLGAFVPLGVGYYWIWSNLFAIILQVILNLMINPKKYIDYEALEKSKLELKELNEIGGKKNIFKKDPYSKREKADYKRFFHIVNKHLVFYSESSGFYKYFQNIIEYILSHSNVAIHYITSDPNDGVFDLALKEPKIKPYYIGQKKLITLMMKMDADIVVMTMPDLNNYHIKRSYVRDDIEYIYTNHGISSDNLTLRTHALDNFDTIFCVGTHTTEEMLALEKLYSLKPKKLVETGYCLLDNMTEAYAKLDKTENKKKTILVAPSWQKDNLLDSCLDETLTGITDKGYRVIVRPHPQYVRIYPERMQRILDKYKDKLNDDFSIETDFSSNVTVYTADLVITDWSNIGYEFSFTTYKPTLYINTPMKIMNPDYKLIDVNPFDIRIRAKIGAEIEIENLNNINEVVIDLFSRKNEYRKTIENIKTETLYAQGKSGEVGGKYILNRIVEIAKSKK